MFTNFIFTTIILAISVQVVKTFILLYVIKKLYTKTTRTYVVIYFLSENDHFVIKIRVQMSLVHSLHQTVQIVQNNL